MMFFDLETTSQNSGPPHPSIRKSASILQACSSERARTTPGFLHTKPDDLFERTKREARPLMRLFGGELRYDRAPSPQQHLLNSDKNLDEGNAERRSTFRRRSPNALFTRNALALIQPTGARCTIPHGRCSCCAERQSRDEPCSDRAHDRHRDVIPISTRSPGLRDSTSMSLPPVDPISFPASLWPRVCLHGTRSGRNTTSSLRQRRHKDNNPFNLHLDQFGRFFPRTRNPQDCTKSTKTHENTLNWLAIPTKSDNSELT